MDYTASERAAQHDLLRAAVLEHLGRHPDALLVVEEYDKLDCPTRGFLRQLLERGHGGNVTTDRCTCYTSSCYLLKVWNRRKVGAFVSALMRYMSCKAGSPTWMCEEGIRVHAGR